MSGQNLTLLTQQTCSCQQFWWALILVRFQHITHDLSRRTVHRGYRLIHLYKMMAGIEGVRTSPINRARSLLGRRLVQPGRLILDFALLRRICGHRIYSAMTALWSTFVACHTCCLLLSFLSRDCISRCVCQIIDPIYRYPYCLAWISLCSCSILLKLCLNCTYVLKFGENGPHKLSLTIQESRPIYIISRTN